MKQLFQLTSEFRELEDSDFDEIWLYAHVEIQKFYRKKYLYLTTH